MHTFTHMNVDTHSCTHAIIQPTFYWINNDTSMHMQSKPLIHSGIHSSNGAFTHSMTHVLLQWPLTRMNVATHSCMHSVIQPTFDRYASMHMQSKPRIHSGIHLSHGTFMHLCNDTDTCPITDSLIQWHMYLLVYHTLSHSLHSHSSNDTCTPLMAHVLLLHTLTPPPHI